MPATDADYRRLSLWHATVPGSLDPRPALPGDRDADVAIVGAGYTGLWTAYYLAALDPSLRVVVLERDIAGFGASGRNGGWCAALYPSSSAKVAQRSGRDAVLALRRELRATVDEVGRAAAAEGIDVGYTKGGTIILARSKPQLERARKDLAAARAWGDTEDDTRFLEPSEVQQWIRAASVLGATYTPHCAAIHPARLVRGLADAVERRGVTVYEGTTVTAIERGRVVTDRGTVRADVVVRATEGYTPAIGGFHRTVIPLYSLMIATEPLSDAQWAEIGLEARPTFGDERHLIIYGQRTIDGRIAFGGRGAPYHFGSRTSPAFDRDPRVFASIRRSLVGLFPTLAGVRIDYRWGGPLAMPRDLLPSVGLDRSRGFGWAGGYVGDGVAMTNLFGRTMADLILRRDTDLVRLPFVGHASPSWEPEPLRWLGVNAGLRFLAVADMEERRLNRPSRVGALFWRLFAREPG
ncbi:MAG TPA: FAD-binding oxidoreductase [Candidatus Limnocylindrales bacterium]